MRQIPAGAFKARCLTVMKQVQSTGEPVIVTKRGTPLVKVVPVETEKNEIFGFLAGKVKIVGDIESPISVPWGDSKTWSCWIRMCWFGWAASQASYRKRRRPRFAGRIGPGESLSRRLRYGSWRGWSRMGACRLPEPRKPISKRSLRSLRSVQSLRRSPRWPINFHPTIPATHVTAWSGRLR